jgi:quinol monooxygenase YgiN
MLLKWITCQVQEQKKESFSKAQEMWGEVLPIEGFLGQLGGWKEEHHYNACILALWEDQQSYDRFMTEIHDNLFQRSNQKKTYEKITISIARKIFDIPGSTQLTKAIEKSTVLRVANCLVKEANIEHFIHAQETIWNPAMQKAEGMLAGVFAQDLAESNRFWVFTLWKSQELHDHYAQHQVAPLLKLAKTKEDVLSITGDTIRLCPRWKISS